MTSLIPDNISAGPKHYRLRHTTDYRYEKPVTESYGQTFITPRDEPGQECVDTALDVSPAPDDFGTHTDYFGNTSGYFAIRSAHDVLSVTTVSKVTVSRALPDLAAISDVTLQNVRDALDSSTATVQTVLAKEFLLPSPGIDNPPELREFFTPLDKEKSSISELLTELLANIFQGFKYSSGSTTVNSTLSQLLQQRQGVCQDFAHLGIAVLRSLGIPAKYTSGYIETFPPPGQKKLVGSDASHAWLSAYIPGYGWIDLDPTNNQFVNDRYIVAARGRDYSDVPPLKGVIFTESEHSALDVSVDMDLIDA